MTPKEYPSLKTIICHIRVVRVITLFISFLAMAGTYGQDYIRYFNTSIEAEYLFSAGDLAGAGKILRAMETGYYVLKPKEYFYLGIVNYLEQDSVSGRKYLEKCAENFGWPEYHLGFYRKMFPQLVVPAEVDSVLGRIQAECMKRLDPEVMDTLNYFIRADQQNRADVTMMSDQVDFGNQKNLLAYFRSHGIPDPNRYGEAVFVILLHLRNQQIFEEYRKFLEEQLRAGRIYPYHFTSMVDRHMRAYGLPTVYNSYFYTTIDDPIEKEKISKNRKSTGLSPYFKGSNIHPLWDFTMNKLLPGD